MEGGGQVFTLGLWQARPGYEEAFVREWEKFATWTAANVPAGGKGYLLRDMSDPRHFISFGPWESMDAVKAWRERPEFREFAARVKDLCSEFQPRTLTVTATSEGNGQ